jgi:tetratricopeptide (TPR) repeat protein
MAEIWNEDSQSRLRAAFTGVQQPWAVPSAERVQAMLDEYTEAWSSMHRDACEATHHAGTQSEQLLDLRMLCLSRRKADLAGLTEMLIEGDVDVLRNAIALSHGLPLVATCGDTEALTARVPPPDDPRAREEVEQLFARLGEGRRLWRAGRLDEATKLASEVVERARELDYAPLESDALTLEAQAIGSADRPKAEAALTDAIDVAMRAGDDHKVAYAASVLIRILKGYGTRERDREIDLWFRLGKSSLARMGTDSVGTYSGLFLNHAQTLIPRGDLDGAEAEMQKAYELRREAWGEDNVDVAVALRGLSMIAYQRRDLESCADYNRRALAIYEKHYGPDHPALVSVRSNLAVVQLTRGQNEDALEQLERVLAIRRAQYGDEHETTADAFSNVGIALDSVGRFAEAEAMLRRTATAYETKLGPETVDTGEALANLASPISSQGRHQEAVELLERALSNFVEHDGPRTYRSGNTRVILAGEWRELGKLPDARSEATAGLEILTEALGADDPRTLNALVELAYVDLAEKKAAAAIDRVEGALERIDGSDSAEMRARSRLLLARAYGQRGDRAAAETHAREGLEIMKVGDLQAPDLREDLDEWAG